MISRAVFLVEMKMILLVELLDTIFLVALYFACYRCNPENSHQRAHLTGFLRRSMAECIWRERESERERERARERKRVKGRCRCCSERASQLSDQFKINQPL